ncbi:hypothetical protein, variant 2 [Aphanomyces astaci]|uniref:Cyclic nucleotide-binding domain-containing protein n=1 Tax=Aphanomyces astaci TaxID=112090 RepID=W4FIN7_APHAT|nr:hypothetical protein, variant 1 [Aphanomyces astaci]XP_009843198.1 hypothetical protein, variant 2 [Aphanomyces astaci]ETV67382.1 hypothetical protein, variant 1 [Aphanomyces astaci]ETV67383.1 hypothetical protein, variant 2 [Aphanomyces astaci]|eukprot:XP_009843197.1 hypothetical protein, variant 1 [Aphanomyces astaci]
MKRDYTLKHATSNRLLPKIERPLLQKKHSVPAICLTPIEAMSSKEAQLSARHVCHRTPSHFENIVKSNTWVLKNALASESSRPIRELHVRFSRAYASYRLHEFAKALADFSHCIDIEPAWHLAYYNRGCTYYKLGRLDDAVRDISKAVKYDPKNKVYLESRATLLRERGNFKEAIEDYNRLDALIIKGDDEDQEVLRDDDRPTSSTSSSPPKPPVLNRRYSTIGKIVLAEDGLHPSLASLLHLPHEERTRFDIVNALPLAKAWRFFQQQSESVMESFLMAGDLESVPARSHIFRQGDDADSFYILLTGSVAVSVEMFENGTITSKKVCTLLPGDGFGEPREIQGPRRATVTALSNVHCLVVRHTLYQHAMRDHMLSVFEEKCHVLRHCRVFETCTPAVVEQIAQLSSVLLFEPYRTILKAGELVDKLFVIKRGVCHVTKSLALDPKRTPEAKRPSSVANNMKKKKSYDGSWVVDNGWQLTNPRLRNEFLDMDQDHSSSSSYMEVTVATLTTGQVFGEVSLLSSIYIYIYIYINLQKTATRMTRSVLSFATYTNAFFDALF